MKKFFRTVIHISASEFEKIIFSAGKIGYQVEVSLDDLKRIKDVIEALKDKIYQMLKNSLLYQLIFKEMSNMSITLQI